jgi:hypothetical protein
MPSALAFLMVLTAAACCACGDYKCNPPNPTLASISRSTARVGTPINLAVKGTNFGSVTVLSWDGVSQPTTAVNATTLTATITGNTSVGSYDVRVASGPLCQHDCTLCGAPTDAWCLGSRLDRSGALLCRPVPSLLLCCQFEWPGQFLGYVLFHHKRERAAFFTGLQDPLILEG